jgi:type IV pilus assembly protein PilO
MSGSARILVTIVGVCILAVAGTFLAALPMNRKVQADAAAVAERQGQLLQLQNVSHQITGIQDEITRLEDALNFFEHRLPQEREIDVILRQVWRIAEAKALVPRSIRTQAPETMARYSSQPITLSLEGPFEGFYDFLIGLEQMPRLTKVRQMQITKMPADDATVQADILMDIYFEKQE